MKHRGMKILAMLLTLAMVVGLMPGMSLTAYADDQKAYADYDVTTTANQEKSGEELTALQVKFNEKSWYIIADNSTAVNAGTVTLLAAESFGTSKFHESNSNNAYSTSTIRTTLYNMTASGSFAGVASAINTVKVKGSDSDTEVDAKLYLLNKDEANNVPVNVRKFSESWWLRSPGSAAHLAACVTDGDGNVFVYGLDVDCTLGVRPALKLNLESVIFSSESKTFSLKPAGYSVTLSGGANATTSGGATTQNVTPGQTMTTVTYTANSGSQFPAASDLYTTTNGITVARTSDTVVTVSGTPTADTSITVPDAAAIPTYTVNVNPPLNGTVTASKATAAAGENITLTITPASGYKVQAATVSDANNNDIPVTNDSFTMPAADVTVTVTFMQIPAGAFTVTYRPGEGSGAEKQYTHKAGETHTVEGNFFTAPDGKEFDCWQGSDGSSYKPGAPVVVNANLTLTAQWKDKQEEGGNSGRIEITGDISFPGGGFGGGEEWYDGGSVAGQRAWKVSLAPMINGSAALGIMSGESTTTDMNVYPNTSIYVFPNPDPGFVLDKIIWSLIDGSASYDITEARNFVMPAMDAVVYVTFKPVG